MKKSRFTDNQIMAVLKRAEAGEPIPTLCQEVGISSALFLPLACQVRRDGRVADRADEGA
jgi:hypothetical protein